jgi:3-isopropylmalate dehydrogenase
MHHKLRHQLTPAQTLCLNLRVLENGERQGYNTLVYSESEIRRIAHSAFKIAQKRDKRLCSVDKANVLECTELWREVMEV